jgi:hypothetical protein
MATQITSTALESGIADAIVTALGASLKLKHYTSADALLATHTTGTATKNTGTSPDSVDITGLTDETNATAGTVGYSILTTSADVEIIRFTDPGTDIGLSSTTFTSGQTVSVTSLSVTVPA